MGYKAKIQQCSKCDMFSKRDRGRDNFELRNIPIPQHRFIALKNNWKELCNAISQKTNLDIRINVHSRSVEIKRTLVTEDSGLLQRVTDALRAFIMGFHFQDAIALLRLDKLYVESFKIEDVKTLKELHLKRALGRLVGKNGKTKLAIENATKTRVVIADTKIHLLGSFQNINAARDVICHLLLGRPPGKVHSKLQSLCTRAVEM